MHIITKEIPTEQGLYIYRCGETDYEWYFAAICIKDDELFVHEEGLGITLLENYHNGLIDLEWKRIA